MKHADRVQACLAGLALDRPPVALWRHFPVDDQTPGGLASTALAFQQAYDFDLVKVTPASSFCLKDWGAQDEWRGNSEGTRSYTSAVIHRPEDWERLAVLDPQKGHLGKQIECLRLLFSRIDRDVPVLQTIFSPLAQAKNLVGQEKLVIHLRRYPEAVHAGLRTIAESTHGFIEAVKPLGIAGIFYAVQQAQYSLLSAEEYDTFGRAYDLPLLESVKELWLNMLHLHGEEVMFDRLAGYPVQVINWHDRDTSPTLPDGQKMFPGAVCGGLQRERTMVLGAPEAVTAEALEAIRATHSQRIILGTGCVLPIIAPHANILAARQSVEASAG